MLRKTCLLKFSIKTTLLNERTSSIYQQESQLIKNKDNFNRTDKFQARLGTYRKRYRIAGETMYNSEEEWMSSRDTSISA